MSVVVTASVSACFQRTSITQPASDSQRSCMGKKFTFFSVLFSRPTNDTENWVKKSRENSSARTFNKEIKIPQAVKREGGTLELISCFSLSDQSEKAFRSRVSHEVSAIKAKNAALKRHSCTSSAAVVPIGFSCVGATRIHVRRIIQPNYCDRFGTITSF